MKPYSDDFKTQVRNSVLNEGMPIKQAVRLFNIDRDTVRRWIRTVDKAPRQESRVPNEIKNEAIKRVFSGEKPNQIAKEYGLSCSSLIRWAREYELKFLKTEIENLKKRISVLEGETIHEEI